MFTIRIMSTQIKDNEHVFYVWVTAVAADYRGDTLVVTLSNGTEYKYQRYEIIGFRVFS